MAEYEVEVIISVAVDGDEEEAFRLVDQIMQTAWDRQHEHAPVGHAYWHFSMLEECVTDVTEDIQRDAELSECYECGRSDIVADDGERAWCYRHKPE